MFTIPSHTESLHYNLLRFFLSKVLEIVTFRRNAALYYLHYYNNNNAMLPYSAIVCTVACFSEDFLVLFLCIFSSLCFAIIEPIFQNGKEAF